MSVEVQGGSLLGWRREGALPSAAPLALNLRAVPSVNSHSAFSPSSPQGIMPAEVEERAGRQGQQGLVR